MTVSKVSRHALALALVPVLLLASARCSPDPARTGTPNVVVIVMDTTRGDRCSVNGYWRPTTPELERFAEDAVVYRNAWSPAHWTPPSHASLFTGLRPAHHGCEPGEGLFMQDEVPTLAEMLAGRDYATAAFVNNPLLDYDPGVLRGFDVVRRLHEERGKSDGSLPTASDTHWKALEWVLESRAAGKPFFLFLNHMEPHEPFTPPPRQQDRFLRVAPTASDVDRVRGLTPKEVVRHSLGLQPIPAATLDVASDLYDAEIAALDEAIGGFLTVLNQLDVLDDTVVVVTSDHGEYLGEHGLMYHMWGAHRSVLHVPLVVRFPGRLDGGRRVDDVVRLEDVVPTVLELCGLRVPDDLDGLTLTGDLPGRVARATCPPSAAFVEQVRQFIEPELIEGRVWSSRSVVASRHHLIESSDGSLELYDIESDPSETRNLASGSPGVVQRMRALLD